jgi:ADP-ribose pyrophosphatase YjhB (NUDIX family)
MSIRSLADALYRAALPLAYRLARQWWRLRRPAHDGALVALWVGGAVLLVRPSYRRQWALPGGGVRPGESAAQAAAREIHEELGLRLAVEALRPVCEVTGEWDYRRECVTIFELRLDAPPPLRLDNREIVATRFVTPSEAATQPLTAPAAAYFGPSGPAGSGRRPPSGQIIPTKIMP